jgi:hypothetical protein
VKYLPKVAEIAEDTWRLEDEDLRVYSMGYTLVVPQGFITDLASVPRPLWPIIAPFELGLAGPIVHDWIYRHGGAIRGWSQDRPQAGRFVFTRGEADGFLKDIMQQDGIPSWRVNAGYAGVRLGGHWSWKTPNNNSNA